MLEWSPAFGPAAVFSGIAALSSVGIAVFVAIKGLGIREADWRALAKRFDTVEKRVDVLDGTDDELRAWVSSLRESARQEREAFQVSVNAGINMIRGELTDFQRLCAERYATKVDMKALEDRTDKGMDRIVDRLEQISGRLETIGDAIIKTLADQRR